MYSWYSLWCPTSNLAWHPSMATGSINLETRSSTSRSMLKMSRVAVDNRKSMPPKLVACLMSFLSYHFPSEVNANQ